MSLPDTPTDAEMIAAVKRLLRNANEGCSSLDETQVAVMRAVLARLEGLAAPGETIIDEAALHQSLPRRVQMDKQRIMI